MTDPGKLEQQLQQLRLVDRLEKDANEHLVATQEIQRRRWELLRRVAGYAGDSYTDMRINDVEEKLRDQGAFSWLSVFLIIGVTFIPVSALTTGFLFSLTKTTQKLLTNSNRALLKSADVVLERELDSELMRVAAGRLLRLPKEIKRTEELVAEYAKKWLEPELTNKLQDGADYLAEQVNKQPFMQNSARQSVRSPDVPVVQVKRAFDNWIEALTLVEDIARKKTRQDIRDLADIATSPDPAKEAKAKEAEATKRGSKVGSWWYEAPSEEPLPKTNKEALAQLTTLRERHAPTSVERSSNPSTEDLWDLQLTIESMIWATTYDFTPRIRRENLNRDDPKVLPYWDVRMEPAPLTEGLWKRLIERYNDPDERKSYKDVGSLDRLGTKDNPSPAAKGGPFSPEVRLSHYFSQVLYPQINAENNEMVQRFSALKVR